jgi:ribosomal protein S18 acetylase RimI-like enzyme
MEIVRAGEDDWPLVRAVRLRALEADPSAFASSVEREAAFTEHDWRDRIRTAAWFVVIPAGPVDPPAGVTDSPAGVTLVRPLEPGADADFEINAMWVAPELRGQRIGESLLDAVLAAVRGFGGRTVRLWVTNGNDGAIALYARRGFLPSGRTEPLRSDPQLTTAEYVLTLG